jgi:hypothetical protein
LLLKVAWPYEAELSGVEGVVCTGAPAARAMEGGWGFEGQAEWRETSRMREVEEEEKEEAERVAEEEDERRAAAPMGVQGVRSVGAKAR